MKKIFLTLAITLGIATILPSQKVHAQAVLLPYTVSEGEITVHPKTLAFLQSYYGTTIGFRSQRGRTSGVPAVYHDSYYITAEDFSAKQMAAYDRNIFETFERVGINTKGSQYDNESFSNAQVDLRAVVTHECFNPVRAEIPHCIEQFGPYYNIRESIEDGTLKDRLILFNPDVSADAMALFDQMQDRVANIDVSAGVARTTLPTALVTTGGSTDKSVEGDTQLFDHSYKDRVRMNSEFVWEVCTSKYDVWAEQTDCYIRNQRLVTDPDTGLFIEASEAAEYIR